MRAIFQKVEKKKNNKHSLKQGGVDTFEKKTRPPCFADIEKRVFSSPHSS